jgi:hypothetical protein
MVNSEEVFEHLADRMANDLEGVDRGKMMSSPGIRYKGKVIAFFWRDAMVFRLGRAFDPKEVGLSGVTHLNPFKAKPAMKDWFVVPDAEAERWSELAEKALAHMVTERG